jgi:phosphomannomutase
MSSSRALRDVTNANNGTYEASAVGEVNVVELMKKKTTLLLAEKKWGIIYWPYWSRCSPIWQQETVLLLCVLSRILYEQNKIELTQIDVDAILVAMTDKYKNENITTLN